MACGTFEASIKKVWNGDTAIAAICISVALIAIGIATDNTLLLSVSTSIFVISMVSASAIVVGKLMRIGHIALRTGRY